MQLIYYIHYDIKNNVDNVTDPFNCVILNKPVSLHLEPNKIKGETGATINPEEFHI